MGAVGGTVLRRPRGEVFDAFVARDVAETKAEIAGLQAEYNHATGEAKTRLQTKLDATQARLAQAQARAQASVEAAHQEAEAKLAALKEQHAKARAERKDQIEKRKAEVEANRQARTAKLERAKELDREAGELVREALVK